MRVSILGAGAIAFGTAALLKQAGHDPLLWSLSGNGTDAFRGGDKLQATGAVTISFMPKIASSCADAVAAADVVVLALPANGHRAAIEAAAPYLRNGQPIIISSHLSFSALYLSKLLAARDIQAPIIAWGTTVLTARKQSPTSVNIGTIRKQIDMATLPAVWADEGHETCNRLFGGRFEKRSGLLAITLSNLNPQNHLAVALLNLTRMEQGEDWNQISNTTPSVGRVIEALDIERLELARFFGLSVKTVQEHFSQSYHVPLDSVSVMTQAMQLKNVGGPGPKTLNSRYVTEDVPFGLLPTILLGRLSGKRLPLHEAGMALLSAAYGRDFAQENDLLKDIGLEHQSVKELHQLMVDGYTRTVP